MDSRALNAPRWTPGTSHVESWFVRVNDPRRPRAIWLRATVLGRQDGPALGQAWFTTFDDGARSVRLDVPESGSAFAGTAADDASIVVGPMVLRLGSDSVSTSGELDDAAGHVTWDLSLRRAPGPLGAPMHTLPWSRLVDARIPRNTFVTPFPAAGATGEVTVDGRRWTVDGWVAMQGHNWGPSHNPEYAWGQCVFTGPDGGATGVLEGASGRVRVGGRPSPVMSMLVVRVSDGEYRFDRILDRWRQRAAIGSSTWFLRMRSRRTSARLRVSAPPSATVRLDYLNPEGVSSTCRNASTALVELDLLRRRGRPLRLRSAHGGALEVLTSDRSR